jgi:hypothetical protein
MAIVTKQMSQVAAAGDTPAYATLFMLYDDATLLVTGIRCQNLTAQTAQGTAKRIDGSRTYTTTWAPGEDSTLAIGSNQAQRLQLTTTPSGKLDGVEWSFLLL